MRFFRRCRREEQAELDPVLVPVTLHVNGVLQQMSFLYDPAASDEVEFRVEKGEVQALGGRGRSLIVAVWS